LRQSPEIVVNPVAVEIAVLSDMERGFDPSSVRLFDKDAPYFDCPPSKSEARASRSDLKIESGDKSDK